MDRHYEVCHFYKIETAIDRTVPRRLAQARGIEQARKSEKKFQKPWATVLKFVSKDSLNRSFGERLNNQTFAEELRKFLILERMVVAKEEKIKVSHILISIRTYSVSNPFVI